MAVQKTEVNPFVRRPLGTRIAAGGKYLARLPVEGYHGFRRWSRPLRLAVAGFGLVAVIALGYAGINYYLRKSEENAIRNELIAIDNEIRTGGDVAKIIGHLDRILELSPNDALARSRKKALETGEGDPSDAPTMMLLYRIHQKNRDADKLIREAKRRLEYEKRDYYANYLLALAYLQKKDIEAARPHLSALGRPEEFHVTLQFDAIAWALQVLGQAGQDTTRLRAFTSEHIWKMIQAEHIANSDPAAQVMMLYLFGETFELPTLPQKTWTAWPAGRKISELCYDGAKLKGDVDTMTRLALLGPRYAAAVNKLHASKQINDAEKVELAQDVEDRTRRAWQYVISKQPKTAEAYNGLMMSYARSGKNREAIESLMHGLEICGDDPQLLERFSQFAILNDKELAAYYRLKDAAERNPKFPKYWMIAANAAFAAQRRDLAMAALHKAREAMPNELEVVCMQATFITGTGYPEKVLNYLSVIPDAEIVKMPRVALIFARALAEVGDTERLDYFLEQVLEFTKTAKDSRSVVSALQVAQGLLDAHPPSQEHARKAAEFLIPILERWNLEYPAASQLRAAALVRICLLKPGPIDPELSRNAIIGCEKALAVDASHLPTVTNLVMLRLLGDKDKHKALSESTLLAENVTRLSPEQAEVLAMVNNANEKYDEALRAVLPHTQSRATAGCWTQLALAYQGQGRTADAQAALDSAARLSMSDRERTEYLRARDLLTRVKP